MKTTLFPYMSLLILLPTIASAECTVNKAADKEIISAKIKNIDKKISEKEREQQKLLENFSTKEEEYRKFIQPLIVKLQNYQQKQKKLKELNASYSDSIANAFNKTCMPFTINQNHMLCQIYDLTIRNGGLAYNHAAGHEQIIRYGQSMNQRQTFSNTEEMHAALERLWSNSPTEETSKERDEIEGIKKSIELETKELEFAKLQLQDLLKNTANDESATEKVNKSLTDALAKKEGLKAMVIKNRELAEAIKSLQNGKSKQSLEESLSFIAELEREIDCSNVITSNVVAKSPVKAETDAKVSPVESIDTQ